MHISRAEGVKQKSSVLLLVLGWISAFISLVKFPFIFGVLGVVMGIIAAKNGSRGGLPLIMASMLLMAAGLIFNNIFYNYARQFLGI